MSCALSMTRQPTSQYTVTSLSNGMTAVHVACASDIDLAGVLVRAGSRMDPSLLPGMAHFVEHTIFKGTSHRRAWHINNRMEAVGGELNAFTSKEETVIYTISPGGNLDRAMQLTAELTAEPTFPDREIDIERAVILDEIDSYLDSLPDAAYDDFEDAMFAGSDLGHNILGTRTSVETITGADCRRFVDTWYTPARMTVFYSGSLPSDRVFRVMERHYGALSRPETTFCSPLPATVPVFNTTRHIDGAHQANTVTGIRVGGYDSPDRMAVALLCNIVGGPGMNSLLNVALRERAGLVYSVEASVTRYSDCGLLALSYGCDPGDTDRCHRIVRRTLGSDLPARLSDNFIARAKRQYIGQITVGGDNRENDLFRAVRTASRTGRAMTCRETALRIEELDPALLRDIAATQFDPSGFATLTLT